MRRVDAGEMPVLKPGDGLVLAAVDSSIDLDNVQVSEDARSFGGARLERLPAGRSFELFVAPAGTYEWRELQPYLGDTVELGDDPEFAFEVRPGRITYPGDLVVRSAGLGDAQTTVSNRGLAAIDWLERVHPVLQANVPFAYAGHYPDPFPGFYRQVRARHGNFHPESDVPPAPPPTAGPLPLSVAELWRGDRIVRANLNPTGTLLALQVREEDGHGVELVDLAAGTSVVLARSDGAISALDWSDDDTLIVSAGSAGTPNDVSLFRTGIHADGTRRYTRIDVPQPGIVVDPLPHLRDEILFASYSHRGELLVHRMNVASQATVDGFRPTLRTRLNGGLDGDVGWHSDAEGRLRLATVRRGDDYVLVHASGGGYSQVMNLSRNQAFTPLGISDDAGLIYGLTDIGRGQRDLVAFDVDRRTLVGTLYSRPGIDVESALFDAQRRPIGVTYYRRGRLVSEYFRADDRRLDALLVQMFAGRTVATIDRSDDGRRLLLWVEADDRPPRLYHFDADRRVATLVAKAAPWLERTRFAPTEVVSFDSVDGLSLEAFITLPPGAGQRPLVVIPHGGPVGVADSLHFDREVQFLASLGYAVLRVNFRGSDGYGRAFREAGHRMHGTRIEDDIDAAISHVLARYPVDGARMCVVGTSYGGYSALMAAVRWPDRFRCVVSIAGISDRVLFFTASDSGRSADGRETLENVVGDPHADLAHMQATSPLYRYDRIRTPAMFVHGLDDRRVDYEHTRRLVRLLQMAGQAPVAIELDGAGHRIDTLDDLERLWTGVAGFLRRYLDGAGTEPDAGAAGFEAAALH